MNRPRFRSSRCRAGCVLVGLDGCEVRLCDLCARVRPCVPCVFTPWRVPRGGGLVVCPVCVPFTDTDKRFAMVSQEAKRIINSCGPTTAQDRCASTPLTARLSQNGGHHLVWPQRRLDEYLLQRCSSTCLKRQGGDWYSHLLTNNSRTIDLTPTTSAQRTPEIDETARIHRPKTSLA